MTAEELIAAARQAGADGTSWDEWTWADGIDQKVYDLGKEDRVAVENAYLEGVRAHRLAHGWRFFWTTASDRYDTFGTEEIEVCGEWHGKTLRKVFIDPAHIEYQTARYGSGLHGSWEEDPREQEARIQAQIAQEKADREERAKVRGDGLAWLAGLSDDAIEHWDDDPERDSDLVKRHLTWTDHRAEERKRAVAKATAKRAAAWAHCRALVPDGATLIDNGCPSRRTMYGLIQGRDPRVFHSVSLRGDYSRDADMAEVYGEWNEFAGMLSSIAAAIERGEYRLAGPDEHIPPRAVVNRIGRLFTEIVRVETAKGVVWVGRPRSERDPIVVDERGHLVRAKKIREAAERVYRDRLYGASTLATEPVPEAG